MIMAETTGTNAGTNGEFLESKRAQYRYFKRILFWSGLAVLLGTFSVIWLIS